MKISKLILLFVLISLLLVACQSPDPNQAARTVEEFLVAMIATDQATLVDLACPSYEVTAVLNMDAFGSANTRVEGLSCSVSGTDGDTTLVNCEGNFIATYNGEERIFDLSDFTYQTQFEAGQWYVCGH